MVDPIAGQAPEQPDRRPESVLVVVYTPKLDILMLQRRDQPDYWQSVTGALQRGESPLQAAQRELFEETGLTNLSVCSTEIRFTGVVNRFRITANRLHRYPPGVTYNTEYVFEAPVAVPVAIRLALDEHLASRWLPAAQAAALTWSSTNRAAILALSDSGRCSR